MMGNPAKNEPIPGSEFDTFLAENMFPLTNTETMGIAGNPTPREDKFLIDENTSCVETYCSECSTRKCAIVAGILQFTILFNNFV